MWVFFFSKPHRSKCSIRTIFISSDSQPSFSKHNHKRRQKPNSNHRKCHFPKWLNKRWNSMKSAKILTIDYKFETILVLDEKNSLITSKYACMSVRSKRTTSFQAIVRTLNGWLAFDLAYAQCSCFRTLKTFTFRSFKQYWLPMLNAHKPFGVCGWNKVW